MEWFYRKVQNGPESRAMGSGGLCAVALLILTMYQFCHVFMSKTLRLYYIDF